MFVAVWDIGCMLELQIVLVPAFHGDFITVKQSLIL